MTRITRRRVAWAAVGVLVLAAGVYIVRVASILAAYKAKMLCSEVLLAHRDPRTVLAELEVDDLAALHYISASVDVPARTATASVAGLISRHASYRDGHGCALVYGSPSTASEPPGRGEHYQSSDTLISATNHALDAVLDRAFAEPNPERPRRTRAAVVVHNGRIVAERYAPGFAANTPILGWSMTKTVMNALIGTLSSGLFAVNEPVAVPEWQRPGDPRRQITLDQLLRMSSGLEFDESAWNPVSDVTVMLLGRPEAGIYVARKSLAAAPGTVWHYSSGTSNVISHLLRSVFKDDGIYHALPRRMLFDRIGMRSAVIETDASGTFIGSSFMYATARDWARLGLLYVNDGVWDGERILPEGWVTYTRSPAPADPLRRYGAHVWLKVAEEYSGDAILPADAFHATGHAGQFVTMIPSANLVVVRLGLTRYPKAWDQTAFVRDVIDAIAAPPWMGSTTLEQTR